MVYPTKITIQINYFKFSRLVKFTNASAMATVSFGPIELSSSLYNYIYDSCIIISTKGSTELTIILLDYSSFLMNKLWRQLPHLTRFYRGCMNVSRLLS